MPKLVIRVRHEGSWYRGGVNVVTVEGHEVSPPLTLQQDVTFLLDPPLQSRHLIVALIRMGKDWSISPFSQFRPDFVLVPPQFCKKS